MEDELRLSFTEVLRGDAPFASFLTADVNYVNARLAAHYGMDATGLGDAPTRVVDTTDHRAGFLGLGAFLTVTSAPGRSSPTERGKWILAHLLCDDVPFGPIDTPDNIAAVDGDREKALFASIPTQPSCEGCHRNMDPLGEALEAFDEIGAYRTTYRDGTPVTTAATLVDGTQVDGEPALAAYLADGRSRFSTCVARTALEYALGRDLVDADEPTRIGLEAAWSATSDPLRALLAEIVAAGAFRLRRGEGAR